MKKSLVILLLLYPQLSWCGDSWIIQAPTTTCGQGSYSSTDVCTDTATSAVQLTANAYTQKFTSGTAYSSWGIEVNVRAYDAGSHGTIEVRIGTSSDLSSGYLGKCTISIDTSAADNWVAAQWTDSGGNPVCINITDTTLYYLMIVENSGDLRWRTNANSCANGNGTYEGSGWTAGGNYTAIDFHFKMIEAN